MTYTLLYQIHLGCALLSISGFILRGWWRFTAPSRLNRPLVKVLPHIIDTLLLASAIMLCIKLHQYPLTAPWLTAKFFALLAYIVLGTIALKRGRTAFTRASAFIGSLLLIVYIVGTATSKNWQWFL